MALLSTGHKRPAVFVHLAFEEHHSVSPNAFRPFTFKTIEGSAARCATHHRDTSGGGDAILAGPPTRRPRRRTLALAIPSLVISAMLGVSPTKTPTSSRIRPTGALTVRHRRRRRQGAGTPGSLLNKLITSIWTTQDETRCVDFVPNASGRRDHRPRRPRNWPPRTHRRHETTAGQISVSVAAMLENPDHWPSYAMPRARKSLLR